MELWKDGNKAGMKTQKKITLLQNDGRKERQEDYPTTVVLYISLY